MSLPELPTTPRRPKAPARKGLWRKPAVYVGYDPREELAFRVARDSLLRRTDPRELRVWPVDLRSRLVRSYYDRPMETRDGRLWCPISEAPMATEFAVSRFVVPFLQDRGLALFVDCDVVFRADVRELFALADPACAVQVVKHDYTPASETKMDDQVQTRYARKNWSSVVLWNLEHEGCRRLTREMLNSWPGRDLHAFKWLRDEEIGSLPSEWNHLVGVYPPGPAKLYHFTDGGPWLPEWKGGPMDDLWNEEKEALGL